MTRERLDELERLHKAATQSEWTSVRSAMRPPVFYIAQSPKVVVGEATLEHDADAIAALHNAAPALIVAARELSALKERVRALAVKWKDSRNRSAAFTVADDLLALLETP